ncbi:MAG: hypothetical protein AMS23_02785 [Bacteroides sp. SM1_62]|nr:MAG: hypothetical protein AMS26_00645 [Bacteroides sp. SM23_62]KPL26175.1 MAG: hypothetical protein AMS23_02785 [Bacteroides sp. SM1_62]
MQIKLSQALLAGVTYILLLTGCSQRGKQGVDLTESIDLSDFKETTDSVNRSIHYTMSLPVEMARLFDHVGVNFYPDLLNPPDAFGKYTRPAKIALNLGVYGVDLSYVKMFNQHQRSVAYLASINRLATEMGIPREIYGDVMDNLELFIANPDSLSRAAIRLYSATDDYLREDKQEGAASLVAMGGWIETMYIATQIYESDPGNIAMQDKIAEQKYSLNSLIALMNNYHADLDLAEYLLMLKNLRRTYNQFQLYYKKGNVMVDTSSKTISAEGYYLNVTPGQMQEISTKIKNLRTLIIH